MSRLAALFGVRPAEVTLLTLDPARRAEGRAAGATCPDLSGALPGTDTILAAAGR